jgi:hypothetical protein
MKKVYLLSLIFILTISGCTQQSNTLKYGCFSCEEMPKELESAKLFLDWYNKISNNNISSGNVDCIEICNHSRGYNEIVFDYNGKNLTVGGTGYIDSEGQIEQSNWWFKRDNFCFNVQECTGIEFVYRANSSWKEEGPRGTCVNKYWATYRSDNIIDYINGFYAGLGIENWTITGTMQYPISDMSKKPLIWGTYNCSCAKHILYDEKVCGMGMHVS